MSDSDVVARMVDEMHINSRAHARGVAHVREQVGKIRGWLVRRRREINNTEPYGLGQNAAFSATIDAIDAEFGPLPTSAEKE